MKRWILTILAWLASVLIVTPVALFSVLVLAGPHAGLLPQSLEMVVLLVGWVAVLGVPILVARRVWKWSSVRTGNSSPPP